MYEVCGGNRPFDAPATNGSNAQIAPVAKFRSQTIVARWDRPRAAAHREQKAVPQHSVSRRSNTAENYVERFTDA